ncbi:hypothetical protein NMG60_11031890 [Bertholletia excelsa]
MGEELGWGVMQEGWRKGPWTAEEDRLLIEYVKLHGEGRWNSVARLTGLKRNGKSCRLRWVNYLRPDLKRGHITPHEESIILELHARWGNRWSTIARSLPGRTDNEIKNYWRTHFKKKDKTSSDSADKAKSRLLRKHQFQQQQLNQVDMKKIISLLDEEGYKVPCVAQVSQEMANFYPSNIAEELQGILHPYPVFNACASVPAHEAITEENNHILWDGLWNLEDHVHGNFGMAWAANCRSALQGTLSYPFY